MMDITHLPSRDHPVVHHVSPADTFNWLKLGWRDLKKAPADAVFYGAVFVIMGYLLVFYFKDAPEVVITLAALFLLAGPFLAIGLYDIARQLEIFKGTRVNLAHSMLAWRANIPSFTLYAALLAVLVFGWFRVSLLMFALFYDTSAPTLALLVAEAWSPEHLAFLIAYFGAGLIFAVVVFAVSVIAIPMMLDKEIDTISAMAVSVQAVHKNLMTMVCWAAIIVILTAIGFATYFIGLMVLIPLIGLSTWHAYRSIITYER
ncbi:DUF2189 domain-containing protein [Craterilacuibacter sp. RT1T]|uniref:DUF2189 domain-containing protein n=1 Tax=Craterilacuibacter sp. RT1T TaxID=2942211 RepID=UPI0020C1810E|nr:DUF2189 domain-containing protein [Craterilacuibacter sp. RT1T]MCL6263575.1 DUF2189 domain-containing protein [Craterilacuibacter sp. RT1T]